MTKTNVLKALKEKATSIYKSIIKKKTPELELPLRSLSNVKYDEKEGYFEI